MLVWQLEHRNGYNDEGRLFLNFDVTGYHIAYNDEKAIPPSAFTLDLTEC